MHDRHIWEPYKVLVRRVRMRCTGCSKTRWVNCEECRPCAERYDAYRTAVLERAAVLMAMSAADRAAACVPEAIPARGCEGCYKGKIIPRWVPACCCGRVGYDDRCLGCRASSNLENPDQVHVCLIASDDEIDHDLMLAMMDSQAREPTSLRLMRKAAALEQNQRLGQ